MAGQPGAAQPRSSFLSTFLSDLSINIGVNEPKPVVVQQTPAQPVAAPLQNWLSKTVANGTASGVGMYLLIGLILVAVVVGGAIYSRKK